MRIAFVTSRFPFPVEKGDKLRAFHQIRLLSEKHEIHLVAISHKKVSHADLLAMAPYCKTVTVFRIKSWLLPLHILFGWLEGLPVQVSYFLDKTMKRKVQYHIIGIEPDHVVCQLIRAAEYVRSLPFKKTLDYMDVFSEGMRQLSVRHAWLGLLFRMEAKRLAAYERTLYKDFDRHTIISRQDRDRLHLPFKELIEIIPNGVDAKFLDDTAIRSPAHDLVFVGNLGYGPNKSAVMYLVKSILPALGKRYPEASVLIAGARPGKSIRQLGSHPQVTVSGWVDDIRVAYRDGRIFVAPMFSGLGLQNKILEAMAMGLPCVTTSMVNNAIGAKEFEEILIADTLDGLVSHIITLLEDPVLYQQISSRGKAFVTSRFKWEDQVEKLDEVIHSKQATLVP